MPAVPLSPDGQAEDDAWLEGLAIGGRAAALKFRLGDLVDVDIDAATSVYCGPTSSVGRRVRYLPARGGSQRETCAPTS